MNTFLTRSILASIISFSCALPALAADKYTLDPEHSHVLWHISHFGFSNPSGKWMAKGTLVIDEQQPQNSKVDVKIRLNDVVTGVPKLDEHLRGKVFFDVAHFPNATFVSDKVDVTSKETATVHGMLTLHGVTKPVVLSVKLNKIGVNPITEKKSVGFSATGEIKRSEFGLTTLLPGVGDNVKLDIEAEAYKDK
jgi:polyisoprenoid-binding protein YceI